MAQAVALLPRIPSRPSELVAPVPVRSPTALAVVSDHGLLRQALVASLDASGEFAVTEQADGLDDLKLDRAEPRAELILLELPRPAPNDFAAIAELVRRRPALRVIVVAGRTTAEDTVRCHRAGVAGYLRQDIPFEELVAALRRIRDGSTVCDPVLAGSLFRRLADRVRQLTCGERIGALELTPRQMQILRLAADGLTNDEIGRRLHLSRHTVKNHVHKILGLLHAADRAAAVLEARRRRWLS
jgi:DNA-binding NarL/FixJ family response regulator